MWDGSVQFKLVSVRSEKPIFALTSSEKFPQRQLSCEKHSQFDVASKGA